MILVGKFGDAHSASSEARLCLARLALARGDTPRALALLESAVAPLGSEPPSSDFAGVHFLLAQTLAQRGAGSDRERARGLAERALADFAAAGPGYRRDAEPVRAFLDRLPR